MKQLAILVLLVVSTVGQEKPKQPNEVDKLRILSAYQKYVIASLAAQQSQQNAQNAANAYKAAVDKAVEEEHLPKGTGFNVNVDTGDVTMVEAPKGKPAPSPEELNRTPVPAGKK